jgi:1-acyl-sn-glycerol-3-phosphate acyltransferase
MEYINCVFIDRNDIRQSAKAILEAATKVKEGCSMVIFPEGTRSRSSNHIGDWKAGAFKVATKAKAPIVPVTFFDSYKVLEGNKMRIRPANVGIIFHDPIYTAELPRDELSELPEKVKNIIQHGLDELSAKQKKLLM